MINPNTCLEHGTFWRCTLPDGKFIYYDESVSRQLIAHQDKDSAPTIVKGFVVYDPETRQIIDVTPTKKEAEKIVKSLESSKIVNEQEAQPETSAPDTATPKEEEYGQPDSHEATYKTDKRAGRKPVRGTGSSRT